MLSDVCCGFHIQQFMKNQSKVGKIKEAFKSVSVTLKKKKKKRGCLVSSDFDLISGSNKQLMQIIQQQSGAIILNMCPLFLNVEGSKPVFIF